MPGSAPDPTPQRAQRAGGQGVPDGQHLLEGQGVPEGQLPELFVNQLVSSTLTWRELGVELELQAGAPPLPARATPCPHGARFLPTLCACPAP